MASLGPALMLSVALFESPGDFYEKMVSFAIVPAATLFILGVMRFSREDTAKRGNWYSMAGMALALVSVIADPDKTQSWGLVVLSLVPAGVLGVLMAVFVKMTQMPEMVGLYNSFGGLAAALASIAYYLNVPPARTFVDEYDEQFNYFTVWLGIVVGVWTFCGSIVACLKLQGTIRGSPILIPMRHFVNLAMLCGIIALAVIFQVKTGLNDTDGMPFLMVIVALSALLGVHFVLAIGGADMPVVISVLNSGSGWATTLTGFTVNNALLVFAGCLIGASGAILSYVMCRAMNRPFLRVMAGGFGTSDTKKEVRGEKMEHNEATVDDVCGWFKAASSVAFVPGYGMAVSQAQHAVANLARALEGSDPQKPLRKVRFGVHPVAGRMPGHMNVLLAEAHVPYQKVLPLEKINPEFSQTDVVMVIGANDTVNPAAMEDPTSEIAGMPVLEVWNAKRVVVLKRSLASGYAGVENPLFFRKNTYMFLGDAKKNVEQLLGAFQGTEKEKKEEEGVKRASTEPEAKRQDRGDDGCSKCFGILDVCGRSTKAPLDSDGAEIEMQQAADSKDSLQERKSAVEEKIVKLVSQLEDLQRGGASGGEHVEAERGRIEGEIADLWAKKVEISHSMRGHFQREDAVENEPENAAERERLAQKEVMDELDELTEISTYMSLGVVKEPAQFKDNRVAVTPESAKMLRRAGFRVFVQRGAGDAASFTDMQYHLAAAELSDTAQEVYDAARLILKVNSPTEDEVKMMQDGTTIICFYSPSKLQQLTDLLAQRRTTLLSMDLIPRITRAQNMDALSSMANIAGYRAVVEAAQLFGRFFTGQITAAGQTKPAIVLAIGAGVAGLAAIGVARGMGAMTRAFDVRPQVKTEVESMGAEFLEVKMEESGEGEGGYARTMSKEFIEKEMELFAQQAREVDIIITTAQIPNRPAPRLILKRHVDLMRPGSVVVDLAAASGGNCELTRPDECYLTANGVWIVGYTDMPSRMANTASQLYSTNLCNLLEAMGKAKDFEVDENDEIVRIALVLHNGELKWPPPRTEKPMKTSQRTDSETRRQDAVARPKQPPSQPWFDPWQSELLQMLFVTALFVAVGALTPETIQTMLLIFVISSALGYLLIWGVTPSLHTPLMSVTNAISGIVVLSGLELMGGDPDSVDLPTKTDGLAFAAAFLAFVNVTGGFAVTHRMVNMFRTH